MDRYQITYDNGITQEKNLISHEDYLNIIKPMLKIIYFLEINDNKKQANVLKSMVKELYGEYFTDKSPLGLAIKTGYLELPEYQGGKSKCKFKKIKK
jgi:hypothetical protein